jgi:hypothetical protein
MPSTDDLASMLARPQAGFLSDFLRGTSPGLGLDDL